MSATVEAPPPATTKTPTLAELGIDRLPAQQRLDLIDALWASLDAEGYEEPPLTEIPAHHREEVLRRLADVKANPGQGRPWREVMAEIAARRQ